MCQASAYGHVAVTWAATPLLLGVPLPPPVPGWLERHIAHLPAPPSMLPSSRLSPNRSRHLLQEGSRHRPSLAPMWLDAQEPACWLLITQVCEKPLPLWTDGGAGAEVSGVSTMSLESLLRDHSARPSSCPHPSPSSSDHLLSITSHPSQSWEAGTVTSWLAAIHPSCDARGREFHLS